MRKLGLRNLALLTLALPFLFGGVIAQEPPRWAVVADIPFSFTVKDTTLPAGKYEIQKIEEWDFLLTTTKGDVKVQFFTEPTESMQPNPASELVFNEYGNAHFLSKIFFKGEEGGYYVAKTGGERAHMKKGQIKIRKVSANEK